MDCHALNTTNVLTILAYRLLVDMRCITYADLLLFYAIKYLK